MLRRLKITSIRFIKRRIGLGGFIFLATLVIYSVTLNSIWATDHSTSFLELDYAIWSNHSFVLGQVGKFEPHSADVFQYHGYYYIAPAPGLAFFSFPFTVVGFILEGHFSVFGITLLSSEFPVALLNATAVLFIYKIGRMFFSKQSSAFVAFAYGFSTISWPFATFFFQSDASAAFDLIAAFLALKAQRGTSSLKTIFLAGLAVAAALIVDYVNAILIPIILGYLLVARRRSGRAFLGKIAIGFLVGSLVGILAIGLYNFASFGQAFVTTEQLYLKSPSLLGDFSFPLYLGLILNLFTPFRGIFLYSPILILGIPGFYRMLKGSSTTRKEGLLLLTLFLGIFLPYSAWYGPDGGLAFGPRFIISSLPFLLLPAGYLMETKGKYSFSVTYLLYAFGVVVNGIAAITTALAGNNGWLVSPFFASIVPSFINGSIDQWWKSILREYWPVGAFVILVAAIFLPMVVGALLERRKPVEAL